MVQQIRYYKMFYKIIGVKANYQINDIRPRERSNEKFNQNREKIMMHKVVQRCNKNKK